MTRTACRISIFFGLLFAQAVANAASVTLVYTGTLPVENNFIHAPPGSLLTFDVVADFSDFPTLGGGFDIAFDSDKAQLDSLTINDVGDPLFRRDPDILDGLLESWAFGSFETVSGIHLLGSVGFVVLPGVLGGHGTIATQATNGIGGPFVCNLGDCIGGIDVQFNAYEFGVVPIPAALWMLLSGLFVLVGVRTHST